jgi:hypothetical protein
MHCALYFDVVVGKDAKDDKKAADEEDHHSDG